MNDIASIANFLNSNLDTPLNELFSGLRGMTIGEFTLGDTVVIDQSYSVSSAYAYTAHNSAVVLNGEIHSLGSSSGTNVNHHKFNGTSWVSVSQLPYRFYGASAVVLNGEIHILGTEYSDLDKKKHYKWTGNSWVSVSTLPYNFYLGCAVVLNDEIHILGGGDNTDYSKHYKWNGSSWTKVSTLPFHVQNGSAVVYNNEIHIMLNTIHYKWNGSSWTKVSTLPLNVQTGSAVVLNEEIHLVGGKSHYKFNGDIWVSCPVLPYTFENGGCVALNGKIHIIGGTNSNTNHYIISTEQYKKCSDIYLFKGNKIYTAEYKVYPLSNCEVDGDHLIVLNNGKTSFGLTTDNASAKVTIC